MGQKTPFFNPNLVAALSQKPFRSVLQDFNRMQAMGKRLAFYKNILAQKYFWAKKHPFLTQIVLRVCVSLTTLLIVCVSQTTLLNMNIILKKLLA